MWLSIVFFMKMKNTMKDTKKREVNVTNCWSGLNQINIVNNNFFIIEDSFGC